MYFFSKMYHWRLEHVNSLSADDILCKRPCWYLTCSLIPFFDSKDNFVGAFYYSTCKLDQANNEFDSNSSTSRHFETWHNCCHQERFQMFITTQIGASSMEFVVNRDLQNFGSTCGSLRKSFWRHDVNNTQPHLKVDLCVSQIMSLMGFPQGLAGWTKVI